MAPRANWKGYLKLSLVSCAVALYPASPDHGSHLFLHTLNRKTGNRLRRQMFDPDTGDVVETEDQAKGYEVAKGQYVVVDDEELDAIALESTHTIDIEFPSFPARRSTRSISTAPTTWRRTTGWRRRPLP